MLERYEAYKDSGVEWIGEVPEHWGVVYPKALFSLRKDKARSEDVQLTASQKYGVIPQSLFMELENQRVVTVITGEEILKHVELGDFVISMRSFQGGLEYSEHSGKISSAYVMVEPNKEMVFPSFFKYVFKSAHYIQALQSTSNLVRDGQAMRFSNFIQVYLPLPGIAEQKAVADYLDEKTAEIDSIVSETERSIELLREYRKSVISEAVTKGLDPNAPMKDSGVEWIGELPSGWNCQMLKTVVRNRVEGANAASGQYIGLENIQSWTQKYVKSESVNDDSSGILYDSRCVMFGKLRPYLAKAYVPGGSGPCSSEFLTLIPGCMNRRYLAYLLTSGPFIDEVNSRTYGVKMPRAGWDLIGKIKVPCPPDIVQCAIANYLDVKTAEIDALIADKERQVELLKEYRKSLISEAVTGKFKVPGVS